MAVFLSPVYGVAGQLFNDNGDPLAGGKIYTYAAGTTTPVATYTNSSGSIAHSNPIVLDGAGRVPTGEIWLTDGILYKFVVKDAANNLIGTYDNLSGINSNFVNFTNDQEIQTATAGQTVFNLTTMQYQPGTNSLSVFVDGVNQYGPGAQYAYVETNDSTVTFVSGLHVGASVKFTTSQLNSSAGADAQQITYTAPYANSVQTNVEDKLSEYISVKDFGAVGDGVTDDTAAFEAAIAAANGRVIDGAGQTYALVANTTDTSGATFFDGTRWAYIPGNFSNMTITGDNPLVNGDFTNVTFLNVDVRTFGQNMTWTNVRFDDGFTYNQYFYIDGGVYTRTNDVGPPFVPNPATGTAWNSFRNVWGFAAVRINRGMGWVNANSWINGQIASIEVVDNPTTTSSPPTKDAHNNVFDCVDIGAFGPQVVVGPTSYIAYADAPAGDPNVDVTIRDSYVDVSAAIYGSVRLVGEQHMTAGGSYVDPDGAWTESKISGHAEYSGPRIEGIGQEYNNEPVLWSAATANAKNASNYISTAPNVQALGTYTLVSDPLEPTGAGKAHQNVGGQFQDVIFYGPETPFTLNVIINVSSSSTGFYLADGSGNALATFVNKVKINTDWELWSIYNPNGGQTKFSNTVVSSKTLIWSVSYSINTGRVSSFPTTYVIPTTPYAVSSYDAWDNVNANLPQIVGKRWGFIKSIPSGATGHTILTITVPQNRPGLELQVMIGAAPNNTYDLSSYGRAMYGLSTPLTGGVNYGMTTFDKYIMTPSAGGVSDFGISRVGLVYTVTVNTSAYGGSPSFNHYIAVVCTSPFNTDGIVVA